MRRGLRDPTALLFVQILGKRVTHVLERRHVAERTRDEDREIAHVDEILVPKMNEELGAREPGTRERGIGPVVLPIHHGEEARCERARQKRREGHTSIVSPSRSGVIFSPIFPPILPEFPPSVPSRRASSARLLS